MYASGYMRALVGSILYISTRSEIQFGRFFLIRAFSSVACSFHFSPSTLLYFFIPYSAFRVNIAMSKPGKVTGGLLRRPEYVFMNIVIYLRRLQKDLYK